MLTARSCTVHHTSQAHHGQHAARIANINECWDNKHRSHTHTQSPVPATTHTSCSVQWRTSHSPHGAVRPSAYLLEPCVFLRDFPHRAVDFLTGEIRLSLHDVEDKAKLGKKKTSPPVRLSLVQEVKRNTAQLPGSVLYTWLPLELFKIMSAWEGRQTAS